MLYELLLGGVVIQDEKKRLIEEVERELNVQDIEYEEEQS